MLTGTENIKMQSVTKTIYRVRGGDVQKQNFCILLKLSCYHFILGCHMLKMLIIIPKVTTKKITKKYKVKEMRRESKWYITKKLFKHKRSQQWRNWGRKKVKDVNKQQNGQNKSFPISNYFKHKQIKLSNSKTEIAEWI